MKRFLLLFSLLSLSFATAFAQSGGGYTRMYTDPDGTIVVDIAPVFVFPKGFDTKRFARLVYNVKLVYPIAKEANRLLRDIEQKTAAMSSKRDQNAYIKQMEKQLKTQYTPVLKEMTFSQGKVLIKLIDRETTQTSYALVKELRGGFSAFLWQGVARLFGANLKDTYDPEGEDRMIEWIIRMYEAGEL